MTECGTLDFPSLASCGHAGPDRQMGSLVILVQDFTEQRDCLMLPRLPNNMGRRCPAPCSFSLLLLMTSSSAIVVDDQVLRAWRQNLQAF
jgi:hypothetical protein